jgi:hypothetical protein
MNRLNRDLLRLVPDHVRLKLLELTERQYGDLDAATTRRKSRQAFLQRIKDCNEHGVVALVVWQRDCDCCEATTRTEIEAVPAVIDEAIERLYEDAEGPLQWYIQRMSDPFEYGFRDRALEAYEDGHPHVIYG